MLPKFTIRHLLMATVAFGFVAMGLAAAYRGNIVALGIVLAPLFMVVPFLVLALFYWVSYFISCRFYSPIHTPTPVEFSPSQVKSADSQEVDA